MVIGYCPNSPTLVVREGNMSFNLNLTCPVNITGSTFCLRNGEVHVPSLPTGYEDDIPSNSEVADSSSTSNDNPITSAADLLRRVRIGQPIVHRNPEVERERPFKSLLAIDRTYASTLTTDQDDSLANSTTYR